MENDNRNLDQPSPTKRTCVTAFTFGSYTRYIPFYVYSILTSYPTYFVKIFVGGLLSENERQCLNLLRKRFANFEIVEQYFIDFNIKDKTLLRWLMPESDFKGFDYVYYGDVDFLIIRENPPLHKMHLEHCEKRGFPFSNEVRHSQRIFSRGRYRLTGLHFIKKEDYFKKMESVFSKFRNSPETLQRLDGDWIDEEFLFALVSEVYLVQPADPMEWFRPLHGFHLGATRSQVNLRGFMDDLRKGEREYPSYEFMRRSLKPYFSDSMFIKLMLLIPDSGVDLVANEFGFRHIKLIIMLRTLRKNTISYFGAFVERLKHFAVRILRAAHLKPPVPESERND